MTRITVMIPVLALAVWACGSKDPTPDAKRTTGLAGFGSACTIVSDTSTECESGVCTDSFNQTTDLCSQKCTLLMMTDPSCPTGSMGQKCNMKGYCRP